MATHCTSEADILLLLKSVKKHLAHLLLLACVADGSFHFSGREIEHAGEQTSAPGLSKKWGEVLPQPLWGTFTRYTNKKYPELVTSFDLIEPP